MNAGNEIVVAAAAVVITGVVWVGKRTLATRLFVRHRLIATIRRLRRSADKMSRAVNTGVINVEKAEAALAEIESGLDRRKKSMVLIELTRELRALAATFLNRPAPIGQFSDLRDDLIRNLALVEDRLRNLKSINSSRPGTV